MKRKRRYWNNNREDELVLLTLSLYYTTPGYNLLQILHRKPQKLRTLSMTEISAAMASWHS